MTSVSSLTDFRTNESRLQDYLSVPLKKRPEFDKFSGVLFVDSGGYKILQKGSIQGTNFSLPGNQQTIYGLQRGFDADIAVNLDTPLSPDDTFEQRRTKMKTTVRYAEEFATLSTSSIETRYLTVHGYSQSMVNQYFTMLDRVFPTPLTDWFDGIAIGSLVPLRNNATELIRSVRAVKRNLRQRGLAGLPIHVFGIAGQVMPLLACLGVDSFDSASYLHSAINGKYFTSFFDSVKLRNADLSRCHCPVCSTPELVSRMRGNTEYQKDILGPVAIHNLIVQKQELERIRKHLHSGDPDQLGSYLERQYRDQPSLRKAALRIINDTLRPIIQ
ncbi:tRNA-guanine transglycosylase [Halogeometricum borinquense]